MNGRKNTTFKEADVELCSVPYMEWGGQNNEKVRISFTYIIPITFGEGYSWRPPLNSSTIDEDMDLAAHGIESLLEEASDGVKVV